MDDRNAGLIGCLVMLILLLALDAYLLLQATGALDRLHLGWP